MGTKRKSVSLPIEIASKLEDLAKSPQYASESFIVSKALEHFFHSLERKKEEKPPAPTEDLRPQLTEALKEIERLKDVLRKETECFSRFEYEGKLFCAKNAPKIVELKIVELPTERICKACRFRITTETLAREIPNVHYYVACGATEKVDKESGITWLFSKNPNCPKDLKKRWHTKEQCKAVGCPLLKTVLSKKK